MSFSFICLRCSKRLVANDDWKGKKMPCPNCGELILIRKDRRLNQLANIDGTSPEKPNFSRTVEIPSADGGMIVKILPDKTKILEMHTECIPSACPVCLHRRGIAAKSCLYCGADLTLPLPELKKQSAIDIIRGEAVVLYSTKGEELFSGNLYARDDGLHITGYPNDSKNIASGISMKDFAGRAALCIAISAFTVPAIGVAVLPRLDNPQQTNSPQMIEMVLHWENITEIKNDGEYIHVTTVNENNKNEIFLLVIYNTTIGQERSYSEFYNQLNKYKTDPETMPHCPGCDRVVKHNDKRCIYCGEEWE